MLKKHIILILLLNITYPQYAQKNIATGQWRDHLPYIRINKIVPADNKVYFATPHSISYYDKRDNSFNTISKVQGLSDCIIASIAYDPSSQTLIIVYHDLNIDFLKNNKVFNLPYIKNKVTLVNKKLNSIFVNNSIAYLACGFGIVTIDINKQTILDTYYFGTQQQEEIKDITIDDSHIFALTGTNIIYKGNKNDPLLVDNTRWQKIYNSTTSATIKQISTIDKYLILYKESNIFEKDTIIAIDKNTNKEKIVWVGEIRSISNFSEKVVITGTEQVVFDKQLQPRRIAGKWHGQYAIYDESNTLWIADTYSHLHKISPQGGNENIIINSPTYAENVKIDVHNGQIWTVTGNLTYNWHNSFNRNGFAGYINGKWHSFYADITPEIANYYDFMNVIINPFNPSQVFIAGWWAGVVLYEKGTFTIFNEGNQNSTIQEDIYWAGHYFAYGLAFDNQQNLWVTNSRVLRPLSVRKKDGSWKSFTLPYVNNFSYYVGDIVVTSWGHKWITVPKQSTLVVFDDNGTIDNELDDRSTTFSLANLTKQGRALLPVNRVLSITEDRNGELWLGTDAGPVVISNASYIFERDYISAGKILVSLDIGENLATYLLETEHINSIAVDGGNRKWLATQNSGAYLVSPDGTHVIQHFNAQNSPMLSNNILDIAIDQKSGEIFFATDKGIISYRGYATWSSDDFGDVYVFPNPVRPGYTGDINITNLLTNSIIKITDIEGNLVYETRSLGGQATWNGKNAKGQFVKTGVYLIFCSNDDGSKTKVIKLLIVR